MNGGEEGNDIGVVEGTEILENVEEAGQEVVEERGESLRQIRSL